MKKVKISELPVINHTLGKVEIDDITFNIEYFTPVAKFRWFYPKEGYYNGGFKEDKILQQLHQGSDGTEKWEDVETVYED